MKPTKDKPKKRKQNHTKQKIEFVKRENDKMSKFDRHIFDTLITIIFYLYK